MKPICSNLSYRIPTKYWIFTYLGIVCVMNLVFLVCRIYLLAYFWSAEGTADSTHIIKNFLYIIGCLFYSLCLACLMPKRSQHFPTSQPIVQ